MCRGREPDLIRIIEGMRGDVPMQMELIASRSRRSFSRQPVTTVSSDQGSDEGKALQSGSLTSSPLNAPSR
jgi:hypothetical protein